MALIRIIEKAEDSQRQDQEDEAGLSLLKPVHHLHWPQSDDQRQEILISSKVRTRNSVKIQGKL